MKLKCTSHNANYLKSFLAGSFYYLGPGVDQVIDSEGYAWGFELNSSGVIVVMSTYKDELSDVVATFKKVE